MHLQLSKNKFEEIKRKRIIETDDDPLNSDMKLFLLWNHYVC